MDKIKTNTKKEHNPVGRPRLQVDLKILAKLCEIGCPDYEIAAVLGFSAVNNGDKVGLMLFSDQVESYVPPKKGKKHVMRLLRDIFYFQPKSKKTHIANALEHLLKIQKRKAIVFLISDFFTMTVMLNLLFVYLKIHLLDELYRCLL